MSNNFIKLFIFILYCYQNLVDCAVTPALKAYFSNQLGSHYLQYYASVQTGGTSFVSGSTYTISKPLDKTYKSISSVTTMYSSYVSTGNQYFGFDINAFVETDPASSVKVTIILQPNSVFTRIGLCVVIFTQAFQGSLTFYPLSWTAPNVNQAVTLSSWTGTSSYIWIQSVKLRPTTTITSLTVTSTMSGNIQNCYYTRSPSQTGQTINGLLLVVNRTLLALTPGVKYITFSSFTQSATAFGNTTQFGITTATIGSYYGQRCMLGYRIINNLITNSPYFKFDIDYTIPLGIVNVSHNTYSTTVRYDATCWVDLMCDPASSYPYRNGDLCQSCTASRLTTLNGSYGDCILGNQSKIIWKYDQITGNRIDGCIISGMQATYCLQCKSGMITDGGACYYCQTNTNYLCTCNVTDCIQCNNNSLYKLYYNKCVTCQSTSLNCQTCTSNSYSNTSNANYRICRMVCLSCTNNMSTLYTTSYGSDCITQVCGACNTLWNNCLYCSYTQCLGCSNQYYLTADTTSKTGACLLCSSKFTSKCKLCDFNNCLQCFVSNLYFLYNGRCLNCGDYYTNCNQCSSSACTLCVVDSRYVLFNGQCPECSVKYANCLTCSSTSCLSCKTGSFYQNQTCFLCSSRFSNCQECSASSCTSCLYGYYFDSGSCFTCSNKFTNCTFCNYNNCLCQLGSFYENSTCTSCSSRFTNCSLCNNSTCSNCLSGNFLQNSACYQCNSRFFHCNECSAGTCTICQASYYLNSINCSTCISQYGIQCLTCNSSLCTSCSIGYFIDITFGCSLCTFQFSNCLQCNISQCIQCQGRYFVNYMGQCGLCILQYMNCLTCNSSECFSCLDGFYVENGSCELCAFKYSIFCSKCDETHCLECIFGYYQQNFTCYSCINKFTSVCQSCNQSQCTQCDTNGYYLQNGTCYVCDNLILNCQYCNSTFCSLCSVDYFLENNTCNLCEYRFQDCKQCDDLACAICHNTFFYSSGQCISCINVDPQCIQCDSRGCTVCNSGYFTQGGLCNNCDSYHLQCFDCDDVQCKNCTIGFIADSVLGCIVCNNSYANCLACNSIQCEICQVGFILFSNKSCILCSQLFPNCLYCNQTTCLQCQNSQYYLQLNGTCTLCISQLSHCIQCTSSINCSLCIQNYTLTNNSCSLLNCQSWQILQNGTCILCSTKYSNCQQCDSLTCTECINGFVFNLQTNICTIASGGQVSVCGDGIKSLQEECDDGNVQNYDGCDSKCKIQKDFVCTDNFNLSSTCKYNSSVQIQFSSVKKSSNQNKIKIYFQLKPQKLKIWSINTFNKLIPQVSLSKQLNSETVVIPYQSMKLYYNPSTKINLQMDINYGSSSLLGAQLTIKIDPSNTNFSIINNQGPKLVGLKLYQKIDQSMLYAYSDDQYQFKNLIGRICDGIGIISLMIFIIGLVLPVGKYSLYFLLTVIQMTLFTTFGFLKLPLCFSGYKNLIYSNGYNNIANYGSNQNDQTFLIHRQIYKNYNISAILFLIFFFIGLFSLIILNIYSKLVTKSNFHPQTIHQQSRVTDRREQSEKITEKKMYLLKIIFGRILFQGAFYILLVSGYLIWISSLYFIQQYFGYENKGEIQNVGVNFVCFVVIVLVWVGYGVLYVTIRSSQVDLESQVKTIKYDRKIESNQIIIEQKTSLTIQSGFSQFFLLRKCSSNNKDYITRNTTKKYFILFILLQKILFSLVVIFLKSVFVYFSGLLAFLYLIVVVLAFMYYPEVQQTGKDKDQQHFGAKNNQDQNYQYDQNKNSIHFFYKLFRSQKVQFIICFSVMTIIQLFFLSLSIIINKSANSLQRQEIFTRNKYSTRFLPIMIVVILLIHITYNLIVFIFDIKQSNLLKKLSYVCRILNQKPQYESILIQSTSIILNQKQINKNASLIMKQNNSLIKPLSKTKRKRENNNIFSEEFDSNIQLINIQPGQEQMKFPRKINDIIEVLGIKLMVKNQIEDETIQVIHIEEQYTNIQNDLLTQSDEYLDYEDQMRNSNDLRGQKSSNEFLKDQINSRNKRARISNQHLKKNLLQKVSNNDQQIKTAFKSRIKLKKTKQTDQIKKQKFQYQQSSYEDISKQQLGLFSN